MKREEINFRWLLYNVGSKLQISIIDFIIISSLTFGLAHYPYLGKKGLSKIIQGGILSILYLKLGILMAILCHFTFNTFVYVSRQNKQNVSY